MLSALNKLVNMKKRQEEAESYMITDIHQSVKDCNQQNIQVVRNLVKPLWQKFSRNCLRYCYKYIDRLLIKGCSRVRPVFVENKTNMFLS